MSTAVATLPGPHAAGGGMFYGSSARLACTEGGDVSPVVGALLGLHGRVGGMTTAALLGEGTRGVAT
ncbi:hypothetical protein ACPZ19_35110 [Amycolatopsis lurida]